MSKMVEVARVLANDPSICCSTSPRRPRLPDARPDAGRAGPALGAAAEDRALRDARRGEAVYLADRIVVLTQRPGRIKAQFAVQIPRRARSKPASPRDSWPSNDRSWRLRRPDPELNVVERLVSSPLLPAGPG